jgi:hypothetical protein
LCIPLPAWLQSRLVRKTTNCAMPSFHQTEGRFAERLENWRTLQELAGII